MSTNIVQRTTIIIPKSSELQFHEKVKIDKAYSITLPSTIVPFKRQDRFTIPIARILKDVSYESHLLKILKDCYSFRLQFSKLEDYDSSIFGDVASPGLSVNFIPQIADDSAGVYETNFNKTITAINQELKKLLYADINDESVLFNEFIVTPTALKYFEPTNEISYSLKKSIEDILEKSISTDFQYLEISYDSINNSDKFMVQFYWADVMASEDLIFTKKQDYKTEVGIFTIEEKLTNVDNTGLAGVRFVLDNSDDIVPMKTSFQFTPRHRTLLDISYKNEFIKPIGLHPKYKLSLHNEKSETPLQPPLLIQPANLIPEQADSTEYCDLVNNLDVCKLYLSWNLPKDFFMDKYQLKDDRMKETGLNLIGLYGETNLELPNYLIKKWGSEALFELNISQAHLPSSSSSSVPTFEIPLHSRYSKPMQNITSFETKIPYPNLFWACDLTIPIETFTSLGAAFIKEHGDETSIILSKNPYSRIISNFEQELQVLQKSPFHHKFLGFESYFDDNTVFYHIQPQLDINSDTNNQKLTFDLTIPVADLNDFNNVHIITLLVVMFSGFYILKKLFH
ncbi:hypothetical protein PACTADRAFT_74808 [Pachysolen tannophilus NRRL Y-2460]|uniref:Protein PBN1 n=1 Tax=Pachysolen tannophilus NRRL Y-2460 TaxID=669874 RepID=A0A1E4TZU7_PACTA|nr:hypothetical protein PACTADRAFT_74808 [Pachysolen tannophilus NRRL Y-2460]